MKIDREIRTLICDLDGTLIDSVGMWNAVDERLIQRIRGDGDTRLEHIQEQRDTALRRFSCLLPHKEQFFQIFHTAHSILCHLEYAVLLILLAEPFNLSVGVQRFQDKGIHLFCSILCLLLQRAGYKLIPAGSLPAVKTPL